MSINRFLPSGATPETLRELRRRAVLLVIVEHRSAARVRRLDDQRIADPAARRVPRHGVGRIGRRRRAVHVHGAHEPFVVEPVRDLGRLVAERDAHRPAAHRVARKVFDAAEHGIVDDVVGLPALERLGLVRETAIVAAAERVGLERAARPLVAAARLHLEPSGPVQAGEARMSNRRLRATCTRSRRRRTKRDEIAFSRTEPQSGAGVTVSV